MSTWTHVNAHFRFNLFSIENCDYNNVSEIENYLGPIKTFKDILLGSKNFKRYYNEDCKLPTGSEGSLRFKVHLDKTGSKEYVNISFFGDLRDYDSQESIMDYFKEFLNDKGVYVDLRSGVVTISSIHGINTYLAKEDYEDNKKEYFFEKLIDPSPIDD